MNDLASVKLNREEFVEWVANASFAAPEPPKVGKKKSSSNAHDVHLYWAKNATVLHPIVFVPQSDLTDFFAFVSTYFKSLRPFTAFIRVLPLEMQSTIESVAMDEEMRTAVAKAVVGGSIAEAWMNSDRLSEKPTNPLPLLRSSLSSTLGSSLVKGYGTASLDWIADEWFGLQSISSLTIQDARFKSALKAWKLLGAAIENDTSTKFERTERLIIEILSKVIREGYFSSNSLKFAEQLFEPASDLVELLASPREDRIKSFNELVHDLKRRNDTSIKAEFTAGLHLAIAGNGSLDLLRSAREFDGWLDGATTWFGICCSFFERSNVLSYASSTGRRHMRDLLSEIDFFDAAQADISSLEFAFQIEQPDFDIRRLGVGDTGLIEIEILPGVSTWLMPFEPKAVGPSRKEMEALVRAVDEAAFVTDRARRMVFEFMNADRQGELYHSDNRRKRR